MCNSLLPVVITLSFYIVQVFLSVSDKTKLSPDLLSLAGCLADHLLQNMEVKSDQLALFSQLPPSFLEWLRKQVWICVLSTS